MQGTADLTMSLCGGIAGFASGFIRRAVGYHVLADLAAISAGLLLVAVYIAARVPTTESADTSAPLTVLDVGD